jgi:hypothetical protein
MTHVVPDPLLFNPSGTTSGTTCSAEQHRNNVGSKSLRSLAMICCSVGTTSEQPPNVVPVFPGQGPGTRNRVRFFQCKYPVSPPLPSGMFVSIDPGTDSGWALWQESGSLVACGLGDPLRDRRHVSGWALWQESGYLVAWGLGDPLRDRRHVVGPSSVSTVNTVWIESQVIYPRSKVPPNDIIKLAHDAGRWWGIYESLGCAVHMVEPAQWKGQVPKAIHHKRVIAKLSSVERETVEFGLKGIAPSKQHNVLDAVGLGLFAGKR